MSVRLVDPNTYQVNSQARYQRERDDIADGSALKVYDLHEKAPTKVKIGVALTTLAGVVGGMLWTFATMAKNPARMKEINNIVKPKSIKDFFTNLTKIKYDEHKDELMHLVSRLAVCSVGGGLLGGAIFDKKENLPAKIRESVIQLVGNIFIPLACVGIGGKMFKDKVAPKIIEKLNLKNKIIKELPSAIAQAGLLIGAIFAGNKVGNIINKKLFHSQEDRKLKISDMAPHLDDTCVAASFVIPNVSLIQRIIPAALTIAGYSVGTAQEPQGNRIV